MEYYHQGASLCFGTVFPYDNNPEKPGHPKSWSLLSALPGGWIWDNRHWPLLFLSIPVTTPLLIKNALWGPCDAECRNPVWVPEICSAHLYLSLIWLRVVPTYVCAKESWWWAGPQDKQRLNKCSSGLGVVKTSVLNSHNSQSKNVFSLKPSWRTEEINIARGKIHKQDNFCL